ncbi:MAG: hypothetical protein RMA76_37735 [Deltaproteobacteria bacterium]
MRALSRDVASALGAFTRVARTRPLYSVRNKVVDGLMKILVEAFDGLFRMVPEVSLVVRPDAFLFNDDRVLEEDDVDASIPFLFYRDGVRRIDFMRGLEERELEVLLDATAKGFTYRGMEDDLVSFLWHQDLRHIRYLTVDVAVVDAPTADIDLDAQIDALLYAIYGDTDDDVGPRSIHLDSSDISAKSIADGLGSVDEMAPGFHPRRTFVSAPAYGKSYVEELETHDPEALRIEATRAGLEAFSADIDSQDAVLAGIALLRLFDGAVVSQDLEGMRQIIEGVRAAEPAPRAQTWLTEALSEARVRSIITTVQSRPETEDDVRKLFERAGEAVVPSVIAALPLLPDPQVRRRFSDLVIALGIKDRDHVHQLLQNDQAFVAREALYLLSHVGHLDDMHAVRQVQVHPKPQVRLALLDMINRMPLDVAEAVAIDLLDDKEARVRVAAAEALVELGSNRAQLAVANIVQRTDFASEPQSVKAAFLRAYVRLQRAGSMYVISQMIDAADRRLVTKGTEDLALAAVQALAANPNQQTVDRLKDACLSKNKGVREMAKGYLKQMKSERS